MTLRHLARRVARLRLHDVRDFARAQVAVLAAQWDVRRRPTGQLVHPEAGAPSVSPSARAAAAPEGVVRLMRAVNRASTYGLTRPLCLARSMALVRLLEADGYTGAALRIGVKWERGEFVAHAWVEYGGAVLDLDPSLSRPFVPLTDARIVATAGGGR